MTSSKGQSLKKSTIGIIGIAALLGVGVLSLLLSADMIASSVAEGALRDKGFVCPEGVDADLSLSDRSVELAPMVCTSAEGALGRIELTAPMTLKLKGAGVKEASVDARAISLVFVDRAADPAPPIKGGPPALLDVQAMVRAVILDMAALAERPWPSTRVGALTLSREGIDASAQLRDVTLDNQQGFVLKAESASLALAGQRHDDLLDLRKLSITIADDVGTFEGSVELKKGIGLATVKIPFDVTIGAKGLKSGSPRWTFSASPRVPSFQ